MTLTAFKLNYDCPYAANVELDWLATWAKEHPKSKIMLIGAGPGVMALAIMETKSDLHLFVVDNEGDQYLRQHLKASAVSMEFVIKHLSTFKEDSSTLGNRWHQELDLLIVDGDHLQAGVEKDIDAWFPHVKVGGLIFFHDYFQTIGGGETGVKEAVEKKVDGRWKFVEDLGISRIYRKMG